VKSPALAIIPEEAPLRKGGPVLEPLESLSTARSNLPRALRALGRIVDGGLCHRCGSCIGICPTGVLSVDQDDYPAVKHLSACTDCDLCVRVCPGDEFNYLELHSQVLGVPADFRATHGHFIQAAAAHSTDPYIREHSTSGGLVTSILLHLLETGQIDGALVIVSDDKQIWKGKPIIARTREQVLSSMKSKYAICPTNAAFEEIRKIPGRYALVGLPCQIHGFIKAAILDARLKSRVVLTVGLFCHAAVEHDAYRVIWDTLGEKRDLAERFVSRIGKHPGTPKVELRDGSWYPVYFGARKEGYRPSSIEAMNVIYRLYTPARCLTCFDGLSEFADISVGDPWLPPPERHVDWFQGWSFTLLRTPKGKALFDALVLEKKIEKVEITRQEALVCNDIMTHEKRWGAFRMIESRTRERKPIPSYGPLELTFPKSGLVRSLKTSIHVLMHYFCFHPRHRDKILRFVLSPAGYWFFWINFQKRTFRTWLRDTLYRVKTRVFGRS
jgi:coenzyme F420 hydrogenase subunit beta